MDWKSVAVAEATGRRTLQFGVGHRYRVDLRFWIAGADLAGSELFRCPETSHSGDRIGPALAYEIVFERSENSFASFE
jgi:hypothetical protein